MKIKTLFLMLFFLAATASFAKDEHGHEHDEHEGGEDQAELNVGPGKGVTEYSEHRGFKLSPEALKTFEVRSEKAPDVSRLKKWKDVVISIKGSDGVFRVQDGFYKWIPIEQVKKGDWIVVQGARFLRIAELDATSGDSAHHH